MLLSARGILANRRGNVKDFFATEEKLAFVPREKGGKTWFQAAENAGERRETQIKTQKQPGDPRAASGAFSFYGFGTQTLQLAAMPPHSAMTSAQPGPTAVTRPVSSTVMMLSSELRHSSFAVVTASTG